MIDFKNGAIFKLKKNEEYAQKVSALLIGGETIIDSFKAMRDGIVFTNKRIIAVNAQGPTGKKIAYNSLPYNKIVAFSVETAGIFDMDAELEIYFSGLGKAKFEFTGSTDIVEISQKIAQHTL